MNDWQDNHHQWEDRMEPWEHKLNETETEHYTNRMHNLEEQQRIEKMLETNRDVNTLDDEHFKNVPNKIHKINEIEEDVLETQKNAYGQNRNVQDSAQLSPTIKKWVVRPFLAVFFIFLFFGFFGHYFFGYN
jgi:Fe2+ transport system protein B